MRIGVSLLHRSDQRCAQPWALDGVSDSVEHS